MVESEKLVFSLDRNPEGARYNLAKFIVPTIDKGPLRKQMALARKGFESFEDKKGFLGDDDLVFSLKHKDRVIPYLGAVNGVPFYMPVVSLFGEKDFYERSHGVDLWLPDRDVSEGDWKLILDSEMQDNGVVLKNWMEKREKDRLSYFRFFLTPYFKKNNGGIIPKSFTGEFEYQARTLDNKFDEKTRIRTHINLFSDELYIKEFQAQFSVWPILSKDEKIVFKYRRDNVFGGVKQCKMNVVEGGQMDSFSTAVAHKLMQGGFANKSSLNIEEMIIGSFFPKFNGGAKILDINKTLCEMLDVISTGEVDDLSGFRQIYFSKY